MKTALNSGRTRPREVLVQPFLKWAGGKRQLLPVIRPLLPKEITCYFEPFLGGGAVFFNVQPPVAVINDLSRELINCYQIIRDFPEELLEAVGQHPNTSEHYYHIRQLDRSPTFNDLSAIERAARLLYLNKTCYNGLFRVNSQGQFNVPFGAYKNPAIANPAIIRGVSQYLKKADITYLSDDFSKAVENAQSGDFVYFDPPYDPLSDTASFTGYHLHGFDRTQQKRLKETCDELTKRGVHLMVSNSDTPYIRTLYQDSSYSVREIQARRAINSMSAGRGKINELLILNYEPAPEVTYSGVSTKDKE